MYSQAKEDFDKIPEGNHDTQIDNISVMQSYGYGLLGDKAKAKELLEKALNEKGEVWLSPFRLFASLYCTWEL